MNVLLLRIMRADNTSEDQGLPSCSNTAAEQSPGRG